jgi:hypothetical protein
MQTQRGVLWVKFYNLQGFFGGELEVYVKCIGI